jgi:hypothetical protein
VILHKKFKIEMRTLNDEFGLDALALAQSKKLRADRSSLYRLTMNPIIAGMKT